LILLVGEPGIGKTRLAEEFAGVARQKGALALWGRCWEGEGTPAFWPWVQIVRAYVQQRDPERLAREMGTGAADIAQVVSEVREQIPGLSLPPEIESAQARFRLFDSFTTFLKNASDGQPLTLICDDLQWADKPSLLLLHFLARELSDTRLLVLGTYRDVVIGREHPLADELGKLARYGRRIVLPGLAKEEVAHFITQVTGTPPAACLVSAVYEKTEGNPFFMGEIIHLLDATGKLRDAEGQARWDIGLPHGVREAIRQHLARLSAACARLLAIAAVEGREFSLDLIKRASATAHGVGTDLVSAPTAEQPPGVPLLALLAEALAAHVIDQVPGRVGRYRFVHALIRETLYEDLSLTDRINLHRQIGEAMEALHAINLEPYLAELADHFFKATPMGVVNRAMEYTIKAAERAIALLAYEEAVGHYQRALQLLELTEPNATRRCALLLALGDAQLKAGEARNARDSFRQVAALAKIQKVHPGLWRHLFASIRTGTFCSYHPELPTSWQV
jgi:predicted ATPase